MPCFIGHVRGGKARPAGVLSSRAAANAECRCADPVSRAAAEGGPGRVLQAAAAMPSESAPANFGAPFS
jgi:hypothetical protein